MQVKEYSEELIKAYAELDKINKGYAISVENMDDYHNLLERIAMLRVRM